MTEVIRYVIVAVICEAEGIQSTIEDVVNYD